MLILTVCLMILAKISASLFFEKRLLFTHPIILSCWAWFKILRVYHCPFNGEVLVPQERLGEAEYFYCPQSCSIHSFIHLQIPEIYTITFLLKWIDIHALCVHLRVPFQTGFVMLSPLFHFEHFPSSAVAYDKVQNGGRSGSERDHHHHLRHFFIY